MPSSHLFVTCRRLAQVLDHRLLRGSNLRLPRRGRRSLLIGAILLLGVTRFGFEDALDLAHENGIGAEIVYGEQLFRPSARAPGYTRMHRGCIAAAQERGESYTYLRTPIDRTLDRPLRPGARAPGDEFVHAAADHVEDGGLLECMRALCAGVRVAELLVGQRTARADGRLVDDDVVAFVVEAVAVGRGKGAVLRAAAGDAVRGRPRFGKPCVLVADGGGVAVAPEVHEPFEVAVVVVAGVARREGERRVGVFVALHARGEELARAREGDARAVERGRARRGVGGEVGVHGFVTVVVVVVVVVLGVLLAGYLGLALGGALGHLRVVFIFELFRPMLAEPVEGGVDSLGGDA